MKIAITGGNGFIGSTLALALLKLDCHELTIYSNRPLEYSDQLSQYKYSVKIGDLSSIDEYSDLVENDVIFHLAQINLVDSRDMLNDLMVNSLSSGYITQECIKKNKTPLIVLASTNNILRTKNYSPPSIWSLHKLFSEQYLNYYRENYSGRVVILRIPNVYGIPVNFKKYENSALNKMRIMASNGSIKLYNNSKKQRAFIHIGDLVNCLVNLIDCKFSYTDILYPAEDRLICYEEIASILSHKYSQDKEFKIVHDAIELNFIEMQDDVLSKPNLFSELKIQPAYSVKKYLNEKIN